ncbi:hypothetical protein [Cryptosporangium aurantiacum]|uniref:Uncharacterized protein n=1 Tax=Cryptosporangium aurantiacum TaxID=134849 RepID=A0A1M7QDP1_9ACTN|nr:hypothetical protein [Cryptosporangium aurantiacum]SHN28906.1 hypothetical protein SAMN05443668_104509 [Cryptosporangium aurantiacum]
MTTVHEAGDQNVPPPAADEVSVWEDDPGAPPSTRTPVLRARPALRTGPLAIDVEGAVPPDAEGAVRYWTAAEALGRTVALYAPLFPPEVFPDGAAWNPAVGDTLVANLNAGVDLNAYYDRQGLAFFRQHVNGVTVWSGESPDIVSHETGHAVLDALCPWMWDAASAEIAAFHESFGDITAVLSGLRLATLREQVIGETGGELSRSSRLSRLAEQLGWAVRQVAPSSADPDCLRNASNELFYKDPVSLPPSAPASQLSSEPHSFSRVFTGAFLRALAGMVHTLAGEGTVDDEALRIAGEDAATLLVTAVTRTAAVPSYYAQVAAHLIRVDQEKFAGKYTPALQAAFVRHGILSPGSAESVADGLGADDEKLERQIAPDLPEPRGGATSAVAVSGRPYGLPDDLTVRAPIEEPRFAVASAAPSRGDLTPTPGEDVAAAFVEDLFRQGRIVVPPEYRRGFAASGGLDGTLRTHEIANNGIGLVLVRRVFD